MKELWKLAMEHQATSALILYWLFSNVVSALPSPSSYTSFYRFFFNLLHGLAGSIGRISPALRIPGPNAADAAVTEPKSTSQPQQPSENP